MKNIVYLGVVIMAVVLSGCASRHTTTTTTINYFSDFYEQTISYNDLESLERNRPEMFLKQGREPSVEQFGTIADIEQRDKELVDKYGCFVLGHSYFTGEIGSSYNSTPIKDIKEQAKEIKATKVLAGKEFLRTEMARGMRPSGMSWLW